MHSKYGLCVAVHLPDLFITQTNFLKPADEGLCKRLE
jgi:hypothetical protein